MEAITRFFIQQGSSGELYVSDENAWYVIRQTWPNVTSALSRCEIETKCASREEAVELAEIYNAPPELLASLAEWSGIAQTTLYQAARSEPQRLRARKRGGIWMSTRRDVYDYKARFRAKPRKK